MAPPNYVFSIFSFIGFVLSCIPFAWHLEAWNVGTCIYMFWSGSGCLIFFINSIIWSGNAFDSAPVYCDITTRLIIGVGIGVPAASLCINRRLYHISSIRFITTGPADKIREVLVDLTIGLGLPILVIALQFISSGHRYNIFEDVGCLTFNYSVVTGYLFMTAPPIAIGLVSAVYAVLSIRAFWKTRSQLNEVLGSGGYRNLSSSRYFRLMALGCLEVIGTVPLSLYYLIIGLRNSVLPYNGWVFVHMGWQRVDQFPAIIWRYQHPMAESTEWSRWIVVVCAFIFFGFFGFADEALKNYRSAAKTISKTIGLSTANETTFNGSGSKSKGFNASNGTLPSFVRKKRNSLDSVSDYTSSQTEEKSKEKQGNVFNPDFSYGALTLNDVGGALAETSPVSASASSASLDTPVDVKIPAFPAPAITRTSSEIEETSRTTSPSPNAYDGMKVNTPDMV